MKRLRHLATVPSRTRNPAATSTFEPPSAHASTIFERSASDCADEGRLAHRCNWSRSTSESTSCAFGRPDLDRSRRPSSRSAAKRPRTLCTVITETPTSRATRAYTVPGSAHANTIRARCPSREDSRAHTTSCPRSPAVSSNSAPRTTTTIQTSYELKAPFSGAKH